MARFSLAVILLTALLAVTVQSIPSISVTGSKFFTSEGDQFYLKGTCITFVGLTMFAYWNLGVAYQLVEDDPLIDEAQCQRDAALMQQLGANSIRVYHVDPAADHSGCMNAFASAGIYLWVDLDSFKTYIRLVSKRRQHLDLMLTLARVPNPPGHRTSRTFSELLWTTFSSTTIQQVSLLATRY